MQMSDTGLELLKRSEGLKLQTYDDNGKPAIGFGHDLQPGECYPNGITEDIANLLLQGDLGSAEGSVEGMVSVPLRQGQFDALVDFTYNLGPDRLRSSTLLRDLNAGQYDAAAQQILLWDHEREGAQEIEVAGLKARRLAEYNLWTGENQ